MQPGPGLLEHRRRGIEGDDAALRKAGQELLGDPAAPAPGVEHGLVAVELEPPDARPFPSRA